MPQILSFSRNRCTSVEQLDEHTLRSICRLQDTLMDASVEIRVKLPDLEITGVAGAVGRSAEGAGEGPADDLAKVIGIRVGPGMTKIIKGLIGSAGQSRQLGFMLEECCQAVILAFTKDVLLGRPQGAPAELRFYQEMVKGNPRLYNRCAAFAPGSSLVEGIEPSK